MWASCTMEANEGGDCLDVIIHKTNCRGTDMYMYMYM